MQINVGCPCKISLVLRAFQVILQKAQQIADFSGVASCPLGPASSGLMPVDLAVAAFEALEQCYRKQIELSRARYLYATLLGLEMLLCPH